MIPVATYTNETPDASHTSSSSLTSQGVCPVMRRDNFCCVVPNRRATSAIEMRLPASSSRSLRTAASDRVSPRSPSTIINVVMMSTLHTPRVAATLNENENRIIA
ncbi:Uncharacterised protein [Mycobacteroides abscessus subsp. abscessus]|nr:Uncharacterised protein [Mycobacteroides abscessus subsp. abscessus]